MLRGPYNNNDDDDDDDDDNGITQAAFPQSGSSSTWGTNGFTSLSKDGAAKEDHLNIQPHGQAGNRTRDLLEDHLNIQPHGQAGNRTRELLASSQRSYQLS